MSGELGALRNIGGIMRAAKEEQKRLLEEAAKRLQFLPLSELGDLVKALSPDGHGSSLVDRMMSVEGKKVRVAVWEMKDNCCVHKQYVVGNAHRTIIGKAGDESWIEAWRA